MAPERRRPADAGLWHQAVADVRPLKGRRPRGPVAEPAPAPDPAPEAEPSPEPETLLAARRPAEPTVERPATALVPGRVVDVDKRTALKLRRGQLAIAASIDLHGLTQAEAHAALAEFVVAQHEAGRRCVLVITGRGRRSEAGGVLRAMLPRWLNQPALRPRVVAIAEAQPRHGGAGAFYLLLRRRR